MHKQSSSSIFEFELDNFTSDPSRRQARFDLRGDSDVPNAFSQPDGQIQEQAVDMPTAVLWIARLVLTAEREVVWSLGDAAVGQGNPDAGQLLRTVARTATQLKTYGVSATVICSSQTVRRNIEWAANLKKAGASVRCTACDEETRDMAVMDQTTAIVRPAGVEGRENSRILVIQNPAVAGVLHNLLHESASREAEPREPLPPTANSARQRQFHRILELMAEGCKDDVAARKAGISLRTYRRYVAEIMRKLGAESRFQAGSIAAQKGLLKVK